MVICVIATASALRGALVIYNQFVNGLKCYHGEDKWHVFVDKNMPTPRIPTVEYHVYHTKGFGRMWFDFYGFKKYCKRNGITPDVIFSLQNTGVKCKSIRNVIYYHQSLPLYHYKYKFFDKSIKVDLFYRVCYPFYVKLLINRRTYVAVQTDTVKDLFSKRYDFPLDKIGVYFPKVEKIDVDSVAPYKYENGTYNFLYPAMGAPYKEHTTLAFALERIWRRNPELAKNIRVHLTLIEGTHKALHSIIQKGNLQNNFLFYGNIPHKQVLSMLKSSNGLLFPSVVESSGLPLLEAAMLGVPIIANDMGYVHDALHEYEGVKCVQVHDYDDWAMKIEECCTGRVHYNPYSFNDNDSWKRLFLLIKDGTVALGE